jgi:hypothetical protein
MMNKAVKLGDVTNGAEEIIGMSIPFTVHVEIEGAADILFHRWNNEAVAEKAKAAKNSAAKKTDNLESYVYRLDNGNIGIPGEYLRGAIIHAAKYRQDPRSPRKSAMDLFKAGVVSMTPLADLGKVDWDFLDMRRVTIQRQGVTRVRPAMKAGWRAKFQLLINTPEYLDRLALRETLEVAGRLIGIGDFRPTFGRFGVVRFE